MSMNDRFLGRSAVACAVAVAASLGACAPDADAVEQIQRYCAASWKNARIAPSEWSDCTQEAFAGLLERVGRDRLPRAIGDRDSAERRELNRAIWRIVQRCRRDKWRYIANDAGAVESRSTEPVDPFADEPDPGLSAALESLSGRQQTILALWSEGDSVAQIARKMSLRPDRVSDEKYKALRHLQARLAT